MNPGPAIHIATCAWSFEDWRGAFYPAHLPQARWLEFYARHFPAVEVDSTFYHVPTPHTAAHWFEVTPPGFRFACKLPREITHERKLRDAADMLAEFLTALEPLGEKLACVLVQTPPFFTPQHDASALREFVRGLPGGVRFAFEFRHAGWHVPRFAHLLEEHRVCWVWSDSTALAQQARRFPSMEVLVGTTAAGLLDLRATPVQGAYPGVEIHANLIAGILDNNIKARPAYTLGAEFALLLLAGLLLTVYLPRLNPLKATLFTLGVLVSVLALIAASWLYANLVLQRPLCC